MKTIREVPNLSTVPGETLNFSLLEFPHLCPSNIVKNEEREEGNKVPSPVRFYASFIPHKVCSLLFL